MYEFEKHPKLTEFIQEMANTGRVPQEWTTFLETLNQALRIHDVSGSFYSLIDRLQAHSEWKYPNRKWNNDAYYGIAFQWIGKEKELEQRVLKLEEEMKLAGG